MSGKQLSVFDYLDYRAFLRDYYVHTKQARPSFSFRAFSKRAKLSSPNHLKRVMEGDRNLTPSTAEGFAAACGLSGQSAEYFVRLVVFNQAKTAEEKNEAYSKLTGFREYHQAHRLDQAHAAYHSQWYVPAIRELVASPDFRNDPQWIAQQLLPPITVDEVSAALKTLLELGLLENDGRGGLRQADSVVATEPETRSVHIGNYHRMMMRQAAQSIDLVPAENRDISAVTLLLDEEGLKRIKQRIQRFRRELIELNLVEGLGRQVVQVNFQLFPLSAGDSQTQRETGKGKPRAARKKGGSAKG